MTLCDSQNPVSVKTAGEDHIAVLADSNDGVYTLLQEGHLVMETSGMIIL